MVLAPGQYCNFFVVFLGEKCSGFYQPKGDFVQYQITLIS